MDAVHVHLMMNHVPLLGTVFGLLLLLYGMLRRKNEVIKASLGAFVIAALAAGAVFLTGEAAEEAIEGLAGVSEALIEPHEEAAAVALWIVGTLGVGALAALFTLKRKLRALAVGVVLVLALAASGGMGWTAYLGGQISHPEIRVGADHAAPAVPLRYEEDD